MIFTSSTLSTSRIAYRSLPQALLSLISIIMLCLTKIRSPRKILLFADDILVYYSDKNASKAVRQVTQSLHEINAILNNTPLHYYLLFDLTNLLILQSSWKDPIYLPPRFTNISDQGICTFRNCKQRVFQPCFSTKWRGGDPIVLAMFYKSFIRSELDYGSVLETHLIRLDRVQHQALRWILDAVDPFNKQICSPFTLLQRLHITSKHAPCSSEMEISTQ